MHLLVSFTVADLKAAAPRAQLLSEVLNRAHTSGLAAVPRGRLQMATEGP